jgi:hypothetical protein
MREPHFRINFRRQLLRVLHDRHGSDGVADRKVTPRTTGQTAKISQPCRTLS